MKTIGEKLKELRHAKGFPQKHIAQLLGVQRPNYSKIEYDKQNLTPDQIKILCEFFDVSADYLLDVNNSGKKTLSKYEKDYILNAIEAINKIIK